MVDLGRFGSMMGKPSRPGIWRRSSTVYRAYGAFGGTIKSGWRAGGAEEASGAGAGGGCCGADCCGGGCCGADCCGGGWSY